MVDCKTESVTRTLLRIECLILQGIFNSAIRIVLALVSIPFYPFVFLTLRWMQDKKKGMAKRMLFTPLWLIYGMVMAILAPGFVLIDSVRLLWSIPLIEWKNRWMYGTPKYPNGKPMEIRDAEESHIREASIFYGVLKDYNEEAKAHGQGADIKL